jgi:hypothetical protein
MRRLQVAFTAMVLSFIAAQSSAGDRTLGPMSITGDQTVFLHFIGNGAATASPFPVRVRFFDSAGALVASSAVSCPPGEDVCPPTEFVLVDSARVTTVSLSGAALGLAGDETMTIQPLVTAFSPGITHLLTTVEFVNVNAAARVALRFDPTDLAGQISLPPRLTLGPLTLGNGELARFNIGWFGAGRVKLKMFFMNASGVQIGTGKAVDLGYGQSEMIELDGDALGIAGVPGVIRAGTNEINTVRFGATLEIIDKATGAVKTALGNGGGVGTSSTGGGSGSQ